MVITAFGTTPETRIENLNVRRAWDGKMEFVRKVARARKGDRYLAEYEQDLSARECEIR